MLWSPQQQLVTPSIIRAGSTVIPVGRAVIYTGNGGTKSVTGAGFSPDLVIIKSRATTTGWRWTDNVRGVGKSLNSAATAVEATEATGVTAFDADGFTLGADTDYNTNAANYLALCLKKQAGAFDIVNYTGTGVSGLTVAHGLGVVPELIIVKNRTGVNTWIAYPGPLASPELKNLVFSSTNAVGSGLNYWGNTAPTSSIFTVGNNAPTNTAGDSHIAYLFASKAGSVKVGSYVGDGATPGPFVTTGFKPRFVLVKATSTTGDWVLFDDARDASNPSGIYNKTNSTAAEATLADGIDLQATGFQFTDTGAAAGVNTSGVTYIYLAIA